MKPNKLVYLPIILFALISSLAVGTWYANQTKEEDVLKAKIQVTSAQVATRLEQFLNNHFQRIQLLGANILLKGGLTESSFRKASAQYQKDYPGLQALNWVDESGIIRWVEPFEPNREALNYNLNESPVAGDVYRNAKNTGTLSMTPPLELQQGGWGITAYHRLEKDGQGLGTLNAVFRLPELLVACLNGHGSDEFGYALRYNDTLLSSVGDESGLDQGLPNADSAVQVAGRELTLNVFAQPHVHGTSSTWIDEFLLLIAIVGAAALSGLVHSNLKGRQKAELNASRFKVLFENAPDAIVTLDSKSGEFVTANGRAYRLFERSPSEFLGKKITEHSPTVQPNGRDSKEYFAEQFELAAAGESPKFEWTLLTNAGTQLITEVHLVRLPNPGRPLIRASITDITERHKLELQLRRTQAHEAMGRLAGGVAHDFNNLLTAIMGASEMLESLTSTDDESNSLVKDIISTSQRAGKLTHQLLAFSRHSAVNPVLLDLNGLVTDLLPILEKVLPPRAHLDVQLNASSPIFADGSQLELALLNLTINARDAIDDGGRVTISTADHGDNQVQLLVHDDGKGISDDVVAHIFEPFFTTKGPGLGTGIGLAAVRQVVNQASGEISVSSSPGHGTTFELLFPAQTAQLDEPEEKSASASSPQQRSGYESVSIFIVEDNPNVLEMMQRTLAKQPFHVHSAQSGEEALQKEESLQGSIDLLICDVVLPGMDGIECVNKFRERRPGLPALVTTGFVEVALNVSTLTGGPVELLPKPFTPSQLLNLVHRLLAPKCEA